MQRGIVVAVVVALSIASSCVRKKSSPVEPDASASASATRPPANDERDEARYADAQRAAKTGAIARGLAFDEGRTHRPTPLTCRMPARGSDPACRKSASGCKSSADCREHSHGICTNKDLADQANPRARADAAANASARYSLTKPKK